MKYTLEQARHGSDINEHLVRLYDLAVQLGSRKVIELGVRTGCSTVALLESVHATGGHLYSVDIDPCDRAKELMRNYGLDARWIFTLSDDIQFGLAWPKEDLVDMVFVDSSHAYDHTTREISIFEPLIRPGGVMAFHDTESCRDGVLRPIEEFLRTRPDYKFENYLNNNGLGIMRKPT